MINLLVRKRTKTRQWRFENTRKSCSMRYFILRIGRVIDTASFVLISTALMLLMTPGLAFLDRGRESRVMLFGHSFGKITS